MPDEEPDSSRRARGWERGGRPAEPARPKRTPRDCGVTAPSPRARVAPREPGHGAPGATSASHRPGIGSVHARRSQAEHRPPPSWPSRPTASTPTPPGGCSRCCRSTWSEASRSRPLAVGVDRSARGNREQPRAQARGGGGDAEARDRVGSNRRRARRSRKTSHGRDPGPTERGLSRIIDEQPAGNAPMRPGRRFRVDLHTSHVERARLSRTPGDSRPGRRGSALDARRRHRERGPP